MPRKTTPSTATLVQRASAAHARAVRLGTPEQAAAAAEALEEAKALQAVSRCNLNRDSRERVAVALLRDEVQQWITEQVEVAPPLTDEQRRVVSAILARGSQ